MSITDFLGRQVSSLISKIRDEHATVIESSSLSFRFLAVRGGSSLQPQILEFVTLYERCLDPVSRMEILLPGQTCQILSTNQSHMMPEVWA